MSERSVGLIAGGGRLPIMVAQGIRASGARVCGVGLSGHYDAALPELCDVFDVAGVYRIGRWLRTLRRNGVSDAALVGTVAKARMHDPLRILRQIPDWRAVRIWYFRMRADRRNQAVLAAVADELAEGGVRLLPTTTLVPHCLPAPGVLAGAAAVERHEPDIAVGWPILRRVAALHIGQAIAVCRGRVVAVEALEGTDALIERTGPLCGGVPWTLFKAPSSDHDMRADVPTIGPGTIERLRRAGGGCLVLEADRVIMVDKPAVIGAANAAGIGIVGMKRH